MITGLNLFHFVALTPTSFNECPGAKSTAMPLPPPSIVSPDRGYTFKFAEVSFNINVSKPAAQSGRLTHALAAAVVTILYDLVRAVAPAKSVPAAETAVVALNVEEPPTVSEPVVAKVVALTVVPESVPNTALFPDSYLSVLRLVKLASTSLFVRGLPFADLNVKVAIYLPM